MRDELFFWIFEVEADARVCGYHWPLGQDDDYLEVRLSCNFVSALELLLKLDVLAQDDHGIEVDGLKAQQGEDGTEELVVDDYEVLALEHRGVCQLVGQLEVELGVLVACLLTIPTLVPDCLVLQGLIHFHQHQAMWFVGVLAGVIWDLNEIVDLQRNINGKLFTQAFHLWPYNAVVKSLLLVLFESLQLILLELHHCLPNCILNVFLHRLLKSILNWQ